jgi:hypothetical protein
MPVSSGRGFAHDLTKPAPPLLRSEVKEEEAAERTCPQKIVGFLFVKGWTQFDPCKHTIEMVHYNTTSEESETELGRLRQVTGSGKDRTSVVNTAAYAQLTVGKSSEPEKISRRWQQTMGGRAARDDGPGQCCWVELK